LHLQTNKVVKRRNLTKIQIPPNIIKQIHALAVLDANLMIFDSAWIAGVDFDKELFEDKEYEEEDLENESKNSDEDYNAEEYDGMDENELADILQEALHKTPNPDEPEEEHGIVSENPDEPEEEHRIVFEL
jgi:hypothetical protein